MRSKTYSNTLAYSWLFCTTVNDNVQRMRDPSPAIHISTKDPPKASGQINRDNMNAKKHRAQFL